jgi:hypothetical protein
LRPVRTCGSRNNPLMSGLCSPEASPNRRRVPADISKLQKRLGIMKKRYRNMFTVALRVQIELRHHQIT